MVDVLHHPLRLTGFFLCAEVETQGSVRPCIYNVGFLGCLGELPLVGSGRIDSRAWGPEISCWFGVTWQRILGAWAEEPKLPDLSSWGSVKL